jgi:hypothetical protein
LQPSADVIECIVICQIEDHESTGGSAIITASDGSEDLLSGGVPELELDSVFLSFDNFGHEFDPESGLSVGIENVLDVPQEKTGFANTGVADDHELEREIELAADHVGGVQKLYRGKEIYERQVIRGHGEWACGANFEM